MKIVNLVKVDDGSVISDDELRSKTVAISDGYILVDCVDGVCKQSQGYVVDGGKNGIAFKGSNNGEATADNTKYEIAECSSDSEGKIVSTTEVCIKGRVNTDERVIAKLGETNIGKHIMIGAGANTPFSNVDNYAVPIKHGYNYAIVDMFESGNKYIK